MIGPPDLVGIISLATDQPHTDTCVARTECTLAHLKRPAFVEPHRDHAAIAARFGLFLAHQLARDPRRLTDRLSATTQGVEGDSGPLVESLGRG